MSGIAGFNGKIYYIDNSCPPSNWQPPSSNAVLFEDEVTSFTIVDNVKTRQYSHDKSLGWEDVVAGTRNLEITIEAVCEHTTACTNQGTGGSLVMTAGKVVYLKLYPYGTDLAPIEGWAMITRVSYTIDIDRGVPVSYTANLLSKGPWVPMSASVWGGFECECA